MFTSIWTDEDREAIRESASVLKTAYELFIRKVLRVSGIDAINAMHVSERMAIEDEGLSNLAGDIDHLAEDVIEFALNRGYIKLIAVPAGLDNKDDKEDEDEEGCNVF